MRSYVLIGICFILTITCFSCRNRKAYDKHVKELDSLKVVIEQSLDNFKAIDSAACVQAAKQQYTYSQFLETHLKDTISNVVAMQLQQFFSVEKGLQKGIDFRATWINNATTSITQIKTLTYDLKNGSITEDEAIEYINEEKRQAEKIIEILKLNTNFIRNYLELHYQLLPVCETLVKQLNSGVLPELIDSNQTNE